MQVAMDFNDLYNVEALEYYLNFGQSEQDFAAMQDGCGGSDDEDGEEKDACCDGKDHDHDHGSKKSKKAPKDNKGDPVDEKPECK